MIWFANRLAKEVGKVYPDHILTFLAYFPTYHPPRQPMQVEPNVEVMFCKEADMFMPVDKGPDNGYHLKYTFDKSKNTYPVPWKKNFEEWNRLVQFPHIAIWDWYCIAAAQPVWKMCIRDSWNHESRRVQQQYARGRDHGSELLDPGRRGRRPGSRLDRADRGRWLDRRSRYCLRRPLRFEEAAFPEDG